MKRIAQAWMLFILLVGLAACADNPVQDEHSHADIAGLALEMDGQEIVVVANAQVTGSIMVPVGEETAEITVEWRDPDGNHFHDEDLDAELSLGHANNDESIATFEQHAGGSRWTFHIHGESAGATSIELQLFNVDHIDFRTPSIPIEVVQP